MRMSVCGGTGPGYLTRTEAVSSAQAGRSGIVITQGGLMTHAEGATKGLLGCEGFGPGLKVVEANKVTENQGVD